MPISKTQGLNYDLLRLLDGIDAGKVALPDFQRDYDWTTADVKALLATVLSGWPIGSLLLMHGEDKPFFEPRAIDQAPALDPPLEFIVLDGQQRLTALYQSLYGRGKNFYALRLDLISSNQAIDALDEAVEAMPSRRWHSKYADAGDAFRSNRMPLTALKDASEFFAWRDEVARSVPASETGQLTELYRTFFSGLHKYEIPAVVIDRSIPIAGIARIFERVNRLGMRLGTFDLMVAKSYAEDFNLREKWEKAKVDYPRLESFLGDDGLGLLTVIALRTRGDVRQQAVLDMPGSAVRDNWERALEAVDSAINFLQRHLGVWQGDWLPFRNILIILAGLAHDFELDSRSDLLRQYFWKTALESRYDVGSNTAAITDYAALSANERNFSVPILMVREDILECTRRISASLHRTILCAIAASGPRDLLTGEHLPTPGEDRTPPRIMSLFEREPNSDSSPHLRSLGMVLASRGEVKGIQQTSFRRFNAGALASQFIDRNSPDDDTNGFFEHRADRFAKRARELFGGPVVVQDRDEIET